MRTVAVTNNIIKAETDKQTTRQINQWNRLEKPETSLIYVSIEYITKNSHEVYLSKKSMMHKSLYNMVSKKTQYYVCPCMNIYIISIYMVNMG